MPVCEETTKLNFGADSRHNTVLDLSGGLRDTFLLFTFSRDKRVAKEHAPSSS